MSAFNSVTVKLEKCIKSEPTSIESFRPISDWYTDVLMKGLVKEHNVKRIHVVQNFN